MRFLLFLSISILLWAGSVSIKYQGQGTSATASPAESCSATLDGKRLMNYLEEGKIAGIRDNGRVLTIRLSSQWRDLPGHTQQNVHQTITCYANTQHRSVLYVPTQ